MGIGERGEGGGLGAWRGAWVEGWVEGWVVGWVLGEHGKGESCVVDGWIGG